MGDHGGGGELPVLVGLGQVAGARETLENLHFQQS